MISIQERPCEKLSGNTSIFVFFDFNQNIVDKLKSYEIYNYNKKTHEWELPIIYLAEILDSLVYLDDIELKLFEENTLDITKNRLITDYKLDPFDYQKEGIKFGLTYDKWLLLDGMGLGKTAQVIGLAKELKAQRGLEHCLIVCGVASLKTNWKKEIQKHSDETCIILGEKITKTGSSRLVSVKERADILAHKIEEFFIITNIETLRSDEVIDALKNSENKIDMIVVDEIHTTKNKTSQQGKNLLKTKAKYKIGLTGTLLLNSPLDSYVPLSWIEKEKANLTTFKKQYCVYGGFGGREIVGYKNLDLLKDELNSCSLRRTKDVLDLPPKNIITEYIDMNDKHQEFYENIKNGVKEEADKVDLKTNSLLALVTRLRQATVCPSILTTQDIKSSKIERCVELINDLIDNNEKVVIFSTFKESLFELKKYLTNINHVCITGDSSDFEMSKGIDKFQNEDSCKLFLGTWQKCGTGITLTSSSYMIFLDTPWTFAVFDQACDRIYRIGTNKSVFIYNLVCNNTIDERVNQLLDMKKAIGDFVVDDKIDENSLNLLRKYIQDL